MAKVKIQGHASGTGIFTVTAPNSNTDRTITLPDGTGTLAFTTGDDDKLPLAGGTMTGTTSHGDNVKAIYGTGNDLEIYHDGSATRVKNSTGNLSIQADTINLTNLADNNSHIFCNSTGVGIGTTSPSVGLDVRGTLNVGVNDTGHDVKFHGATSGCKLFWDESLDRLRVEGRGDGSDIFIVTDNSADILNISNAAIVFNQDSGDRDFRIESDNVTHALFMDGTNGKFNIGHSTSTAPSAILEIDSGLKTGTLGTATDQTLRLVQQTGAGNVGSLSTIGMGMGNTYANVAIAAKRTSATAYGTDDLIFALKSGTGDTAPAEKLRITGSGGNIYMMMESGEAGTSTTNYGIAIHQNGGSPFYQTFTNGTGLTTIMVFGNDNGVVGNIRTTGSATQFNTSSDYRLKENVDYDWDATTRLKQLKPARFNFITDDTNTLRDGFLAHEVSSIVPEAISGEKDGMIAQVLYTAEDEETQDHNYIDLDQEVRDGLKTTDDVKIAATKNIGDVKSEAEPDYQVIDQSKLVPLLVKTIQELEARITALEA